MDKLPLNRRVAWRITCASASVIMFAVGYAEAGIGAAIAGNMF